MAGLESIALAVAHLEREGEKAARGNSIVGIASPSPPMAIPTRRRFDEGTPRRVSNDSACDDHMDQRNTSVSENSTAVSMRENQPDVVLFAGCSLAECLRSPPIPQAPTEAITEVLEDDVLCGRGGETNHHPGNVKYRALVKRYQPLYIVSKRRDKPRIAEKIVLTIRQRGGRFLKKEHDSNVWRDVGNTKAREKTSQALREGAPELRSTKGESRQSSPSHAQKQQNCAVRVGGAPSPANRGGAMSFSPVTPPPPTKRQRISAAISGANQLPFAVGVPMSCGDHLSPCGFVATISGDDEDSRSSEQSQPVHGPRLKILKRRLQQKDC